MCLLGVQGPGVHMLGGGVWGDPQGQALPCQRSSRRLLTVTG